MVSNFPLIFNCSTPLSNPLGSGQSEVNTTAVKIIRILHSSCFFLVFRQILVFVYFLISFYFYSEIHFFHFFVNHHTVRCSGQNSMIQRMLCLIFNDRLEAVYKQCESMGKKFTFCTISCRSPLLPVGALS